jgi:hypothetical protein
VYYGPTARHHEQAHGNEGCGEAFATYVLTAFP